MNTQTLKGLIILTFAFGLFGFQPKEPGLEIQTTTEPGFNYMADRFADIQVLRYKVDGFDELSLQQKELAYYLYQAGLCGRDIFYDQKYRYGLTVRKTLEGILQSYSGEKKRRSMG